MASPLEFKIILTDAGVGLGVGPNIPLAGQAPPPFPPGAPSPYPQTGQQQPVGIPPAPQQTPRQTVPQPAPAQTVPQQAASGVGAAPDPYRQLGQNRQADQMRQIGGGQDDTLAGQLRDMVNKKKGGEAGPDVRDKNPYTATAGAAYQMGFGNVGNLAQTMGRQRDVSKGAQTRPGEMPGMAVAQAAGKAIGSTLETAGKAVRDFARPLEALAKNNHVAMFTTAVDAAATNLQKIPVVGDALAGSLRGLNSVVNAFASVTKAFTDRGRELAQYSPELSRQEALTEIAGIKADIREANQLGPELAQLMSQERQFDQTMRELLLPIKEFVVKELSKFMEQIQAQVNNNTSALNVGVAAVKSAFMGPAGLPGQLGEFGNVFLESVSGMATLTALLKEDTGSMLRLANQLMPQRGDFNAVFKALGGATPALGNDIPVGNRPLNIPQIQNIP